MITKLLRRVFIAFILTLSIAYGIETVSLVTKSLIETLSNSTIAVFFYGSVFVILLFLLLLIVDDVDVDIDVNVKKD